MRPDQDPDNVKIRNQCCRTVDKPRDPDRTRDLFGLQLEVSLKKSNSLGHSPTAFLGHPHVRLALAETQYAPAAYILGGQPLVHPMHTIHIIYLISIYVYCMQALSSASRASIKAAAPRDGIHNTNKARRLWWARTLFAPHIELIFTKTSYIRSIFVYGLGNCCNFMYIYFWYRPLGYNCSSSMTK